MAVAFNQLAEGGHLLFQLAERAVEGAEFLLRGLGIFQGHADNALGRTDVGVKAGLDPVQRGFQGVVDRQLEVVAEHLPKVRRMLFDGRAHLGLAAGALAQPDQHRRQHVGAQRVVHHVGFHVVAQHGHAHFVVLHRLRHPGRPQVTDQAHDQRGEQPGPYQQQ
ncbi:hypothetical protein D3C76_884650 [compost metagenome]